MPTKAEGLTKQSSDAEYQAAVSACIEQQVNEGKTQEQAAAICYSMAKEATGREYPKKAETSKKGIRITGFGTEQF